jgi:hypothetical protein
MRAEQTDLFIELRDDHGEGCFGVRVLPCGLVAGGADQVILAMEGAEAAMAFLQHPPVISALRAFSVELMNQGRAPSPRTHCEPLARDLLSGDPTKPWS